MNRRGLLASGLGALAVSACSPLALFNTFTPKDGGAKRVLKDAAYGADPRQKLDLYAPPGARDLPLLTFFYGGSWDSGSKDLYRWAGLALASQGFVVAVPDYRLVPEVRFPDFVEDCAVAVAKAAALAPEHGADPTRLLLSGHSAGAYNAAMIALDKRYLQRAGVDPARVKAFAGLAGPYDFYPFDVKASIEAFGGVSDPRATQPINFVRPDAPPLWLAAGDKDTTVRPRNSIVLGEKERQAGGTAEVKLYPGLDHVSLVLALSKPFRDKGPVLADMAAFLKRHAQPG
jgi:acetyl esterase/lipase